MKRLLGTWRPLVALAITLAVSIWFWEINYSWELRPAEIGNIIEFLRLQRVSRVEVYHVPYSVVYDSALSSAELELQGIKFIIEPNDTVELNALLLEFSKLKVRTPDYRNVDARWGIVLYDHAGARFDAIYINGLSGPCRGQRAKVGRHVYWISGNLVRWLERLAHEEIGRKRSPILELFQRSFFCG